MKSDLQFSEYVIDHQNRVSIFRGYVLNYMLMIEGMIETFIANTFVSDDKLKLVFIDQLLGNKDVSFSTKINIFESILKVKYSKKYDKSLINKINNKRQLRNKLAHYTIRSVKENIKSDSLFFLTIENYKIKHVEYTVDTANELINDTFDLMETVGDYINGLTT